MDQVVGNLIASIEFAAPQHFDNMTVLPLLSNAEEGPEYLALESAMKQHLVQVTELNGGTVPNLGVTVKGALPVLLLDGEELAGAKQNRVVNTTILLKENSKTVIPVSCTEQGRWQHVSAEFSSSGNVMHHRGRINKMRTVSDSLEANRGYRSDQGQVWNDVAVLSAECGTFSPTGAMRDVFDQARHRLEDYLQAFEPVAGQRGVMVFVNGRLTGMDYVSRKRAYEDLHVKILRSYAMDAISSHQPAEGVDYVQKGVSFLESASRADDVAHPSVGYGTDHRIAGHGVLGSALVHEGCVIHTALFKTADVSNSGGIWSATSRLRQRMGRM